MKRPVWLFSMDSEQFFAPPTTTGALVACYLKYGKNVDQHHFQTLHFQHTEDIEKWKKQWLETEEQSAFKALENKLRPVIAFSFYTWNAAPFLDLLTFLKKRCPELLAIAGGPHVQQAEDYLLDDPMDIIVLGEGEFTFCELLDAEEPCNPDIPGIAYLDKTKALHKTAARKRTVQLDDLPSALTVIPLTTPDGAPLYTSIAYETTRGCPFTCAFCEWGTGAIGTKMLQFSLDRIRSDLALITQAGIKDIWFADSNFGALKEDLEKTRLIIELKNKTGLPSSFATSWSKNHSPRVQEIVRLLHHHQLLPHYQLALQTLTPEALKLSNRQNMQANKFEPIAKQMSAEGIPIAAELIWGLPGDNLKDFQQNLDYLLSIFPNINIFGYTLLPGTEFYKKRQEYKIKSIPVAGYGKALGEYVVACHTYSEEEGYAGYYLITAHILFVHGYILPLTTRYIALSGWTSISGLLCFLLTKIIEQCHNRLPHLDFTDYIHVYENRNDLYLHILEEPDACFSILKSATEEYLKKEGLPVKEITRLHIVMEIDRLLCPRVDKQTITCDTLFDFSAIMQPLSEMRLPDGSVFSNAPHRVTIEHSGGLGTFLKDADGGSWIKGRLTENKPLIENTSKLIASSSLL
ncbi:MAG: cobalamin-dependent protein [Pseudomonadales bacterium]|nr:cobalamin-dependent protein [Pseudomonadales bacterium]